MLSQDLAYNARPASGMQFDTARLVACDGQAVEAVARQEEWCVG